MVESCPNVPQEPAIIAVQNATPVTRWIVVALTTSREIADERLTLRDAAQVAERLVVWDDTPTLDHADLRIDTGNVTPDEAARQIDATIAALLNLAL